jgi:hypothetical protein
MNVSNQASSQTTLPPYGVTFRMALAYEAKRQRVVSASYRAISKRTPEASRNWIHFQRAGAAMLECGCRSEEEWIDAQFVGASQADYPYPSNLYSKRARKRWGEYVDEASMAGRVRQQVQALENFQSRFPLPASDIVLSPIADYEPWFQAVHADSLPLIIAELAKAQLIGSTVLRREIDAAGFDVVELERKIDAVLQGG